MFVGGRLIEQFPRKTEKIEGKGTPYYQQTGKI